jgi:hypothetical protein
VSILLVLLVLLGVQSAWVQASHAAALGRSTRHSMRVLTWRTPQTVAVAVPAASFPVSVYPYSDRAANGVSEPGCPAPTGLSASKDTLTRDAAARQIDALSESKYSALSVTDTTMWPNVILHQVGAVGTVSPSRLIVQREAASDVSVTKKCGSFITSATWVVEACPALKGTTGTSSCTRDPALVGYFYFVKRSGHWLITFVYG